MNRLHEHCSLKHRCQQIAVAEARHIPFARVLKHSVGFIHPRAGEVHHTT
jgi:hypothetical protein